MSDGRLLVVFNFMPPSFVPDEQRDDLGRYQHFDKEMEAAVGAPVLWEDRELILIREPRKDAIERLRLFVEHYHAK